MRKPEHHVPPGGTAEERLPAPPGRRLHPFNALKLWLFDRNLYPLHLHLFAPTQAGAPLVLQRIGYYVDVIIACHCFENLNSA